MTSMRDDYDSYSPPYISIGNLISTAGGFAVYTLAFTYVLLTEHKLMWQAIKGFWTTIRNPRKSNLEQFTDPQSRMMARYPEVPDWWFGIFACCHSMLVSSLLLRTQLTRGLGRRSHPFHQFGHVRTWLSDLCRYGISARFLQLGCHYYWIYDPRKWYCEHDVSALRLEY
ncbi:hypothetical protein V1505DRAFT_220291 [Lipomyces doorenjongii]